MFCARMLFFRLFYGIIDDGPLPASLSPFLHYDLRSIFPNLTFVLPTIKLIINDGILPSESIFYRLSKTWLAQFQSTIHEPLLIIIIFFWKIVFLVVCTKLIVVFVHSNIALDIRCSIYKTPDTSWFGFLRIKQSKPIGIKYLQFDEHPKNDNKADAHYNRVHRTNWSFALIFKTQVQGNNGVYTDKDIRCQWFKT